MPQEGLTWCIHVDVGGQELQGMDLKENWVKEEASSRRTSGGIVAQAFPDEVFLQRVLELVDGPLDSLLCHSATAVDRQRADPTCSRPVWRRWCSLYVQGGRLQGSHSEGVDVDGRPTRRPVLAPFRGEEVQVPQVVLARLHVVVNDVWSHRSNLDEPIVLK